MRRISLKFLAVFLLAAVVIPLVRVADVPFAHWLALIGVTAFVLWCACMALERADRRIRA